VVDEPPPPPLPADTPGGGPLPPYLSEVRKRVSVQLVACVERGGMLALTGPALAVATVAHDGELRDVILRRSSGAEAFDACLVRAFREAKLPPPPTIEVGPDGFVVLPDMAFR
jgi:TonB family protein